LYSSFLEVTRLSLKLWGNSLPFCFIFCKEGEESSVFHSEKLWGQWKKQYPFQLCTLLEYGSLLPQLLVLRKEWHSKSLGEEEVRLSFCEGKATDLLSQRK
jgi:hypothetical protein